MVKNKIITLNKPKYHDNHKIPCRLEDAHFFIRTAL